jgi:cytidine deaminase
MRTVSYAELSAVEQRALVAAKNMLPRAYNPYSHFYVAATLITPDGKIITGTNFENAAYGSTICAERAAVLHANARGMRKFVGIAIIARGENFDTTEVTGPCGSCRQVLYEVAQISGTELKVICATTKMDKIVIATIKELLPLGFGPVDLGIDISRYQK